MNLTSRIAYKQLRSRHSFGFISFSTYLSILGLTIGIASLIIIASVSDGFSTVIHSKLSSIDGHLRIKNFLNNSIDAVSVQELQEKLLPLNQLIHTSAPYIEKNAFIRHDGKTEGVIIYGVTQPALQNIFNLNQFTQDEQLFSTPNSIFIGAHLADKLSLNIGDTIILFNAEKLESNQLLNAEKFYVEGVFKTEFPEYDRLLLFTPVKAAQKLFHMENKFSGLIANVYSPSSITKIEDGVSKALGNFPYYISTWKTRHNQLLYWLSVYDLPIKLIMIFITTIAIFNIAASLWMIIIEKTKEFGVLLALGLTHAKLKFIIIKESIIIGFTGALGGITLSLLILLLQRRYQIIQIPNDIYFMDHLPVEFHLHYFIFYPVVAIVGTFLFAFIPAYKVLHISPANALRYE
ncbi:MAG: ABC transporter permease [Candidatus Marinimicrobia bacterium]|nr:ABC transporter permease [Candidatus Neomarinimicrobiota bacterium]